MGVTQTFRRTARCVTRAIGRDRRIKRPDKMQGERVHGGAKPFGIESSETDDA